MPNSYTQHYFHIVFSTKYRRASINPQLELILFPFIGGIVRDLGATLLQINGMPDHIHLLVRAKSSIAISDLVRHIKARSTHWLHETQPNLGHFNWQEGYASFTVSQSAKQSVEQYILHQKDHHQEFDFQSEFEKLLKLHGIEFHADELWES